MEEKTSIFSQIRFKYILWIYGFIILAGGLWYTARVNPEIFKLHPETLLIISETYNALVLLMVPFLFGAIGASARTLLAELTIAKNYKIILASGLLSSFSWLGIKSKVFIALLTPYIATNVDSTAVTTSSVQEFYSMALVAVLVGMFSSNIYIFINAKVEKLTNGQNNV